MSGFPVLDVAICLGFVYLPLAPSEAAPGSNRPHLAACALALLLLGYPSSLLRVASNTTQTGDADFGPNGFTVYQQCPQATGTKTGCIERYEIGPATIRVYVWTTQSTPASGVPFVGRISTAASVRTGNPSFQPFSREFPANLPISSLQWTPTSTGDVGRTSTSEILSEPCM